jgi:hypothetical protein
MKSLLSLAPALVSLALATGCIAEAGDEEDFDDETTDITEDALKPGKNGKACIASPYNCKLRKEGGNAVDNSQGGLWAVHDATMVDGNGESMGLNTRDHLRFNYGQTRHMGGHTYVFARSSTLGSAGWFPIDEVYGESSLRKKVGEVNAKDTGGERLGCYKVRSSHDAAKGEKKVVFDSQEDEEEANDYMSTPRKNGKRYANMAFAVPGFGLGGPAIDIFPAGTRFRRIDVPTTTGDPSITIPLWAKDGNGNFTEMSGKMKFIYGYVNTEPGTKRFGWMALDALVATDC